MDILAASDNRDVEDEMIRPPDRDRKEPRPTTEPPGNRGKSPDKREQSGADKTAVTQPALPILIH